MLGQQRNFPTMQAYIAHAEADQAIADELKESLLPWGFFAQTETGAKGFRHLQASDVVIALWSKHCLFSPYRMQMERRMLEAWADGRLVLVKLDHQFLPVGLRDLPAIDATFESARGTVTWREVQRAAKDAMNRALVEVQRRQESFAADDGGVDSLMDDGDEEEVEELVEEEESAPALFVSYAHADADSVTPLVKVVEDHGRRVWIDKGEISAGEGWAGEIVRGIKAAGGLLVMCSPRAFESDHIKREIYLADRYKKQMLPVFLESAEMPEDFEYFFAGVQWLELFKLTGDERGSAMIRALAALQP